MKDFETVLKEHKNFIYVIVNKIRRYDNEDLIQIANLSLYNSFLDYDESRGIPFTPYAGSRITIDILQYLNSFEKVVFVPQHKKKETYFYSTDVKLGDSDMSYGDVLHSEEQEDPDLLNGKNSSLLNALSQLSPIKRSLVEKKFGINLDLDNGLTLKEIADSDISFKNVKSMTLLYREAISDLKKILNIKETEGKKTYARPPKIKTEINFKKKNKYTLEEFLESEGVLDKTLSGIEKRNLINKALLKLQTGKKELIELYFGLNGDKKTLDEIGLIFNRDKAWVFYEKNRILTQLKKILTLKEIKTEWSDKELENLIDNVIKSGNEEKVKSFLYNDSILTKESMKTLITSIDKLKNNHKRVIEMYFGLNGKNMSLAQIAKLEKCNFTNIFAMQKRALKKLKEIVETDLVDCAYQN